MSVTLRYPTTSSKYQTFYSPSPVCLAAQSVRRPSAGGLASADQSRSRLGSTDKSTILESARKRASSKNLDPKDKDSILSRVRREYQQKQSLEGSKNANILMRVRLEENRKLSQKQEQLHSLQQLRNQKQRDSTQFLDAIRNSAKSRAPVTVPRDLDTLYMKYSEASFRLDSAVAGPSGLSFSTVIGKKPQESGHEATKIQPRASASATEPLPELPLTESLTLSDTKASKDLLQRVSQLLAKSQTSNVPPQHLAELTTSEQHDDSQQGDSTPQKKQKPKPAHR